MHNELGHYHFHIVSSRVAPLPQWMNEGRKEGKRISGRPSGRRWAGGGGGTAVLSGLLLLLLLLLRRRRR